MRRRAPVAAELNANYFALRSSPGYRDWLERLAESDQRHAQSLVETALYRYSAAIGHPAGPPPRRLLSRYDHNTDTRVSGDNNR